MKNILSLALSMTSILMTLSLEAKAEGGWYYSVCTESTHLNIRSGPGTNFPIIYTLPNGSGIHISPSYDGGYWAPVQYYDITGWAAAEYICYN